jgi:hypothetical protein
MCSMSFPLDAVGCRQWAVSGPRMSVGRGGNPLLHPLMLMPPPPDRIADLGLAQHMGRCT